jgi:glycosyltransferase involved in cell wall biosynthesis
MKYIFLYLAKPIYGGWVSFTAHLSLKTGISIYKIGNNTETKERDFGYGTKYRNINIDTLKDYISKEYTIIITAIDKNYYYILDYLDLNEKNYIVIHDPTEFNKKSKKQVIDILKVINVITIRKSVHNLLLNTYNINSIYKIHPYYSHNNKYNFNNCSNNAVSISRIDYDKNIDIILNANKNLTNKVELYGDINERYIYHKLSNLDSFKKDDSSSMYRGKFPKKFGELENILRLKSFVVDMSTIANDGGETQYTFLEAIDYGCILVLNKKWCDNINNIWVHNYNCIVVENSVELYNFLENDYKKYSLKKIYKNSLEILERAKKVDWEIF